MQERGDQSTEAVGLAGSLEQVVASRVEEHAQRQLLTISRMDQSIHQAARPRVRCQAEHWYTQYNLSLSFGRTKIRSAKRRSIRSPSSGSRGLRWLPSGVRSCGMAASGSSAARFVTQQASLMFACKRAGSKLESK